MRIQYLVANVCNTTDNTNVHFITLLKKSICKYDNVEIVNQFPDIIHLCGDWSIQTIRQINKIIHHEIPVIFTCNNGLNVFSKKKQHYQTYIMRNIISKVSAIQVCGPLEKEKIQVISPSSNIYVIPNPIISNTINTNEIITQMIKTYKTIINNHDTDKKEIIKNKIHTIYTPNDEISIICSRFLYIKYLLHKGYIPKQILTETSNMLKSKQYDEDEMKKLIKKLGIYDFISSLLYVMNEKSELTEGFMPIESSNDKLSDIIADRIKEF